MQFPEPHHKCKNLSHFFCNDKRENIQYEVKQRQQTSGLDMQHVHERTNPQITKKTSLWSPLPVQAAEVTLAISKLKNTKSTGRGLINLQHIKESYMVTVPYITLIINT